MFIEITEDIKKRFSHSIEIVVDNLQIQEIDGFRKIECLNAINEFHRTGAIEHLDSIREDLLLADPSLERQFKIVDFLRQNNALDSPNCVDALAQIKTNPLFSNSNESLEDEKKIQKKLADMKEKCHAVLAGDNIDVVDLAALLDFDGEYLLEEEKLMVLTNEVYKSCKVDQEKTIDLEIIPEVIETLETEVIEELEEPSRIKTVEEGKKLYQEKVDKIDELLNKHYELLASQKPEQLNYKKMVVDIMRENPEEFNKEAYGFGQMQILDAKLSVSLLYLSALKKDIKDALNEEELELATMLFDDLESNLTEVTNASILYTKEEEEKEHDSSKILFLLDTDKKPLFDIDNIGNEERKRMNALLSKFDKGQHDYEQGVKATKVMTRGTDFGFDIFVNRSSDMACSYVRLQNDLVLVLDMENRSTIYDESAMIAKKYRNDIFEIKNSQREKQEEMALSQAPIIKNVRSKLSNIQGGPSL